MFDSIKKNESLKTAIILLFLIFSVVFLYNSHFKMNFGAGDNLEWYKEAMERNTLTKIFDFSYSSGRLGPSAYFNPVQLMIWQYMAANYGQQPQPYHFLVILMHLANVILVFFLADKFIKNKFFSFLVALSFALYYLNFKTTGWIAPGICYGLSAFFTLTSLLLMTKYFKARNIFFLFLSLLAFFLGTLTKETVALTTPILLACYIITIRKKDFKFLKDDFVFLYYLILSLPIILITLLRLNGSAINNVWGGFNFGFHMFYRFIDFMGYLITIIPVSPISQTITAAIILLLSPVLIYSGLKDKKLLFLIFWLFLSISIYTYSNFRDIHSLSRYLYLPSVAWFGLLYYIVANIKNLKIKIISSFFLINYTIILNLFLILTKQDFN